MQGAKKERWLELCEQIALEQDSRRMVVLAAELNELLEEKARRLNQALPNLPTEVSPQAPASPKHDRKDLPPLRG